MSKTCTPPHSAPSEMEPSLLQELADPRNLAMFERAPVMLHSIDSRGILVCVSDLWLEKLGYERGEVIGHPSTKFLTEESRAYACEHVLPEFFRTGRVDSIQYTMVCKSGSRLDVQLSAVLVDGHSIAALVDLTEQRRLLDELSGEESRYRKLHEEQGRLLDLIRIHSENLKALHRLAVHPYTEKDALFRDYLKEGCRMFGCRVGAIVAASNPTTGFSVRASKGNDKETLQLAGDIFRKILKSGETQARESAEDLSPLVGLEGTWIAAPIFVGATPYGVLAFASEQMQTAPFSSQDREIIGMMAGNIGQFIGWSRAQAVIAQQKAKMIASSKMASLGEMAGGIAHEINNPLTIIHGKALQIYKAADKSDRDSILSLAKGIETMSMRIATIVKGLKNFARDGSSDPYVLCNIRDIIDDALALCQARFRNHSIEMQTSGVEAGGLVECRPVQLAQVLLNLLNNAFDAVRAMPQRWIRIETEVFMGQIRIVVSDSGPGIPFAMRDKAFQPFFTTKPLGEGTGLGLSISKGIVESHGGTLELDPSSIHTCFVITIPTRQTANPPAQM